MQTTTTTTTTYVYRTENDKDILKYGTASSSPKRNPYSSSESIRSTQNNPNERIDGVKQTTESDTKSSTTTVTNNANKMRFKHRSPLVNVQYYEKLQRTYILHRHTQKFVFVFVSQFKLY